LVQNIKSSIHSFSLKITKKDLSELGGHSLLLKYNSSMLRLLTNVYPNVTWTSYNPATQKFKSAAVKKSQYLLKSTLKELFPEEGN
jgi:type VI protein secretion system component VasK